MASEPLPFSLRQLQYAAAVADTLSFRRAAERCHVSQPSLSAQLAHLETVLGVRLFERDRRRVLPTAAGKDLLERARRVLRDAEDLVQAARQLGDPLAGSLRIGVIPTISSYLLPGVSPALRRRFPRLRLAWVEDKTGTLVRDLERGGLDAALLALEGVRGDGELVTDASAPQSRRRDGRDRGAMRPSRVKRAPIGDVEVAEIAKDPFVLALPRDHPLAASGGPAGLSDLREASVLLLDEGHCFRDQALAYCSRGRAHELEFRATSLATLAQMVAGGAGVTLLPALAVPTESRRARIQIRPLAHPAPGRTIALVWRRQSPLGGALRQIAETIAAGYLTTTSELVGRAHRNRRRPVRTAR
jgi:LysR family transcriptional regulator, hydrogen peroxide-inducible genes activator